MEIDTYFSGILIILGSIALSIVGLVAVRRLVDLKVLESWHVVSGNFFALVGTLYAVLLGLIVVDAMSRFQQASNVVDQEANALADIFLLSERLPERNRLEVQHMCASYVDLVVNKEWNAMDDAAYTPDARKAAVALIKAVRNIEPRTNAESAIFSTLLTETCQLWDSRRARIVTCTKGLPTLEWVALIVGGIVTVVFTFFFAVDSLMAQITMTAMVTLLISLNIFLILMFGYPFSGQLKVHPDTFKLDQEIFENRLGLVPRYGENSPMFR